jgi:TolA-binding protein
MRLRGLVRWPLPRLIASSVVSTILMGCAPNADNQQVQADQFALRGMVASNQQQIDSLQEKIQRLGDRISELEHNGSASAGGGNQIASIEQRLNKLESQANPAQPSTASVPPTASTSSEMPSDSSPAPGVGGGETPGTGGEEAPGGVAATTPANAGSAAPAAGANAPSWRAMMDEELATTHDDPGEKLYRAGLVQLKANQYSQALSQLQTLQRRYPKSGLSEPAEFFAANALYEMGRYDQAILQFNDQTMRFPKGHFASAALLREAQAFMKINDRIDARLTLQKLLSDLPNAAEAPMAKSMMQTLAS